MSPKVAVVILNFNTKDFLGKYLPGILSCNYDNKEVWVVDNASSDDSLDFVVEYFPEVKTLATPENLGYAGGYAWALPKIEADYFALINSDIEVTSDWLANLVNRLKQNPKIAAVQPKILDLQNRNYFEYAGGSGGFLDYLGYPYCRGRIFDTIEQDKGQYDDAVPILWASGACFLIRSDTYFEIDGLDADLFAHMEEIDLCWRLHHFGYEVWIEPSSVVYHLGGGTLKTGSFFKNYLNLRNSLIVLVKNHPSRLWFFIVIVRMILDGVYSAKSLLQRNTIVLRATLKAHAYFWKNFRKIYQKRKNNQKKSEIKKLLTPRSIVCKYYALGVKCYSGLA
jgi:GT2 family glycosyltransferase